jgi:hypothetical protein
MVAMEKRLIFLEGEVARLNQLVQEASNQALDAAGRLPNTSILSPNLLTRAFAVWGHAVVAQLLIGIPIYCLIFLLAMGSSQY